MRSLTRATAGLVGSRDPAQPLLTLVQDAARVELSGATTANWVAKTANLLVDGLGQPARVGVLLPLHWQTVVVVLAGVATGATVEVTGDADGLAACDVAFTTVEHASAALSAGAGEVVAVSTHPLGLPPAGVPPLVVDGAREVPGHGDAWSGPEPTSADVRVAGGPVQVVPSADLGADDRVLCDVDPADPAALAALLGALAAGAALVLAPGAAGSTEAVLARTASAEGVTATLGLALPGLPRLH